jgi:co-chaperonin GroES (HSP10)
MIMPRQHVEKIIVDEDSESKIGSHQLPRPIGWKVLVQPSQVKKKSKGGILLPSESQDAQEYLTAHGTILAMGDLAYRDRDTGQGWKGDWPSNGDRITYGRYAGQKMTVNGVKLILLNDDEVTSVVPEDVTLTTYVD